jgi:predicted ATPase/DNA-binding SARP family transcriptional activator/predicted negative regulator of RcsB-dependent stress response
LEGKKIEGSIRVRLLGAIQVERDGEPVGGFRSRKALALLGYLAAQDQPVSRERLVDLLWEDKTESQGRNNLSWVLNKISSLLPDLLQADRRAVRFHPTVPYWLDTEAFKELVLEGDVASLASAAELYRGEFLEGLYFEGCAEFELWAVGEREQWRQSVVDVLWELISHYNLCNEYELSLHFARRLLALNPWQEEAHRHVMQALARVGQRSAALTQYENCRQVLAQELGVEPAEETKELCERIYAVNATRRHNLPVQPTAFIGREEELAEVCQLLSRPDCRLLTILGPGGIGKTRLALQAAEAKIGAFLEGVYFVPLAAASSTEHIVSAIADASQFSLTNPQDPQARLFNYLRGKEMLLVLDSLEHLLDGTPLLVDLLREAPEVKLLVTSRERLNLRWERCFEIAGLTYPQGEVADDAAGDPERYSALRLFQEMARRVRRDFVLSIQDRPAVTRLCQVVEGMPLGIELAAAWVRTHTCDEIAQETERSLDFLTTSMQDVPERQRSMRATFEHSWQLLTPAERDAFARLSVFRRGFQSEAASEVANASPSMLESLESKSLLRFEPSGRYEMHEMVRQFAADRLTQTPEVEKETHDRHCTYYATFLRLHEADLLGADVAQALETLRGEIDNVRAAWHWGVTQGRVEDIERSLGALSRFYHYAGPFQEGKSLVQAAIKRIRDMIDQEDEPDRGKLQATLGKLLAEQAGFLCGQGLYDQAITASQEIVDLASVIREINPTASLEAKGHLHWGQALFCQGEYEAAKAQLKQALELAQAASLHQAKANALSALGAVLGNQGDYASAKKCLNQALSVYREMNHRRGEGMVLNNLGHVCLRQGNYDEAKRFFEQTLQAYRQVGERQMESMATHNLGRIYMQQGHYDDAKTYLEQSLRINREIGNRLAEGWGLLNLGRIALVGNDHAAAKDNCERALRVFREIGVRQGEGIALINLGAIFHQQGHYTRAWTAQEQALLICREIGDRQSEGWALGYLGSLSADCGDYAGATTNFEQTLLIYREIGDQQGEARGLADLCLLSHQLGDDQTAMELGQQALLIAQELGDRPVEGLSLTRLSCALTGLGHLAEAAEVCQQSLGLQRELGEHALAAESLAALARVSLAQGNLAQAQTQVDEILVYLENNSPEGTDEPFRVYLTCYRVLHANQDPRAQEILTTAHRLLQERAAKISDDELRRSFLENVAAHREIIEEVNRFDKMGEAR